MNEEKKDAIHINYEFFKEKLPEFLKDESKKDKFVLIKDQKVIGFYENEQEALNEAIEKQKFEFETFIVQKVEKEKAHVIFRVS